MSLLKKEECMFDRDEKGELIPVLVKIDPEGKSEDEILALPLTRAQSKKLILRSTYAQGKEELIELSIEQDKEILLSQVVEPKFTAAEVDNMKPWAINKMTEAILRISGLRREKEEVVPKK